MLFSSAKTQVYSESQTTKAKVKCLGFIEAVLIELCGRI